MHFLNFFKKDIQTQHSNYGGLIFGRLQDQFFKARGGIELFIKMTKFIDWVPDCFFFFGKLSVFRQEVKWPWRVWQKASSSINALNECSKLRREPTLQCFVIIDFWFSLSQYLKFGWCATIATVSLELLIGRRALASNWVWLFESLPEGQII